MNPFITLARINRGGKIRINVNHIVCFHQKTYSDSSRKYTYILLTSGNGCSREVEETPDEIDELINHAVFNIPFTQTHLKGA